MHRIAGHLPNRVNGQEQSVAAGQDADDSWTLG